MNHNLHSRSNTIITNPHHHPAQLGLKPAIVMHQARQETFFYRGMDKRVIGYETVDPGRFEGLAGPLVYMVTDRHDRIRYVGRHLAGSPLRSRWIRRGHLHHQHSSRNQFINHLDGSHGNLTVWCASTAELIRALPACRPVADARALVTALEALWIRRYSLGDWNVQAPAVPVGFEDGLG